MVPILPRPSPVDFFSLSHTSQMNLFFQKRIILCLSFDFMSHILLFHRSKSKDFQPEIYVGDSLLNVFEESKILGVILTSDLKWAKNTQYIVSRCMKRIWTLRRIREVGGSQEDLVIVYILQICCIAELACPSWNVSLTKTDIRRLKHIQKVVCRVIL